MPTAPATPADLKMFTGTASFDADILGVVVLTNNAAGIRRAEHDGHALPRPPAHLCRLRGLDFIDVPSSLDSVTISADRRTLTMTFEVQNIMDEVRVVTQGRHDRRQRGERAPRPQRRRALRRLPVAELQPGGGRPNGVHDVFLRDLQLDTTERVSLTNAGGATNGPSVSPAVSRGGRYVAFASDALQPRGRRHQRRRATSSCGTGRPAPPSA